MFTYAKLILAALSLASIAAALPASKTGSSIATSCTDLPGGFNVANNFTLAAYNTTLPNANYTGSPLVLAGQGAEDGAEFFVLATWNTFPYGPATVFNMVDGGISSTFEEGDEALCGLLEPTDEIQFILTSPPLAPWTGFCGIASTGAGGSPTSQFPQLAVGTDTDSFYLCIIGSGYNAYYAVIYQPGDPTECYPVQLHMIVPE